MKTVLELITRLAQEADKADAANPVVLIWTRDNTRHEIEALHFDRGTGRIVIEAGPAIVLDGDLPHPLGIPDLDPDFPGAPDESEPSGSAWHPSADCNCAMCRGDSCQACSNNAPTSQVLTAYHDEKGNVVKEWVLWCSTCLGIVAYTPGDVKVLEVKAIGEART